MQKSKQGLLCWDVEKGKAEKTKSFLSLTMAPYEVLWHGKLLLVSIQISHVEMTDDLLYALPWHFHRSFIKLGHRRLTFQKKNSQRKQKKMSPFHSFLEITSLRLYFRKMASHGRETDDFRVRFGNVQDYLLKYHSFS